MSLRTIVKEFKMYKKRAGNPFYAACFGKTFLKRKSDSLIAERVGAVLIKEGFGVIHGGYSGVMAAISIGAERQIILSGKSKFLNIGIPMNEFDTELERNTAIHVPPAEDIFERKTALVVLCDLCIALPAAGFGTLTEVLDIIHSNQIAEKFGGKIRPVIFLGARWKRIIGFLVKTLDFYKQSQGMDFMHFTDEHSLPRLLRALRRKL